MHMMKPALPLLLAAALAGCTVGPNYSGPPQVAPIAPGFVRAETPSAAPAASNWWTALNDPVLDRLIERAFDNNPDVAVAQARLRQSRAELRLQRANGAPNASATALYARARIPGLDLNGSQSADNEGGSDSGGTTNLNLYNLGFDASWEIDLFGGQRRTVEAARASAEAASANVADVRVSLSAEIAQAYINLRDRQRRLALNQRSADMQARIVELTRQRFDRGAASRLDIVRLENQLAVTRADITPLNAEIDAYLDVLATLSGDAPGATDAALRRAAPVPLPPDAIAVGDPAGLLRRRPDLRAAERNLAASTARIGTAEAARFPRLSFMGIIGIGGTSLSQLGHLDDFTALAAPQLSWSFLDFGRNRARVEQAQGSRDEAEARYRSAVLGVLRDAEDSLSRFRYRRGTVATLARAKASADEAVVLSEQRYRAGTSTLIDLLDAQRQQLSAEQGLSAAEAQLTNDFVAIQKALGLGWSDDKPGGQP
jgi:NodT family efflux transporter outer membrane factor (OMF) lipoprotein